MSACAPGDRRVWLFEERHLHCQSRPTLRCSVRLVMTRASGIKRLETDDMMEMHMHKAVPLRPAVNRVGFRQLIRSFVIFKKNLFSFQLAVVMQ